MADGKLTLEIVTPSRRVMNESCDEALLPAEKGEVGILPGHAPFVSTLTTGRVRFKGAGRVGWVAVRGGFLQVVDNKIMVLADEAALQSEVDATKLSKERADLEQKLVAAEVGVEEREQLLKERDWLDAKTVA